MLSQICILSYKGKEKLIWNPKIFKFSSTPVSLLISICFVARSTDMQYKYVLEESAHTYRGWERGWGVLKSLLTVYV